MLFLFNFSYSIFTLIKIKLKKNTQATLSLFSALNNIKKFKISAFILLIFVSSFMVITPQKSYSQLNVSFQIFYDELSAYGTWVENIEYGYVWVPSAEHDFFPYGSNGYWLYTEFGWAWYSNYPWGWAPFHYGRWFYDPFYGWIWVPGYHWAGAWVTWRQCPGYYGWAPLGPDIGYDLAFSNGYYLPHNRWRFIRRRDIRRRDLEHYYTVTESNAKYLSKSTVIKNLHEDTRNNTTFNAGPVKREVESYTGQSLNAIKVNSLNTPSQSIKKNELFIYRPEVKEITTIDSKPSPKTFNNWKEEQPKKEQPTTDQSYPAKGIPAQQKKIIQPPAKIDLQPIREIPKQEEAQPQKPSTQQNIREERQPMREIPKQEEAQPQKPPTQQNIREERQPTKEIPKQEQPQNRQPAIQQPAREVRQPVREMPHQEKSMPQKIIEQRPLNERQISERPVQGFPIRKKPKKNE